jgi:hypothetical protein
MAQNQNSAAAAGAAGASGGARQQNPPAFLKAEEVVEIERTPDGVKLIRRVVIVDAETGKFVRNLCLPCDEEWYDELYGDASCVCEKDISVIDEITLQPVEIL